MHTTAGFLGKKGMGKSTALRACVFGHLRELPDSRFVVLDSTREWARPSWLDDPRRLEILPPGVDLDGAGWETLERAPCVLVVDEIDRHLRSNTGPLKGSLAELLNYGRHLHAAVLFAARRPARVHPDVLNLSEVLFLFRLTGANDLRAVAERCGSDVAETIARLPQGEFVRYED